MMQTEFIRERPLSVGQTRRCAPGVSDYPAGLPVIPALPLPSGCPAARLPGCPTARLPDCPAAGSQNPREILMLITFKSSASPDVRMLENLAQYLLGIVGKSVGQRGVITHEELPAVIARLEAAVSADKQNNAEHKLHHGSDGHDHENQMPVGLAQRAFPFLDMLRESQKQQADILWGV
jgi:hypothetical protein